MNIHTDKPMSHVAPARSDKARRAVVARDAADATLRFASGQCWLGSILVAASGKGICAILLGDESAALLDDLHGQFPRSVIGAGDAELERLLAEVISFVEAPSSGLDWPLDLKGTSFQRRVWQALRETLPGATVSYADIAGQIGSPKAVRAVARACAGNHIAIAIPCHRVIRGDGALSGYRWGVARRQALLAREALR